MIDIWRHVSVHMHKGLGGPAVRPVGSDSVSASVHVFLIRFITLYTLRCARPTRIKERVARDSDYVCSTSSVCGELWRGVWVAYEITY